MKTLSSFVLFGDASLERLLSSMDALRHIVNSGEPLDIDYDELMGNIHDMDMPARYRCSRKTGMSAVMLFMMAHRDVIVDMYRLNMFLINSIADLANEYHLYPHYMRYMKKHPVLLQDGVAPIIMRHIDYMNHIDLEHNEYGEWFIILEYIEYIGNHTLSFLDDIASKDYKITTSMFGEDAGEDAYIDYALTHDVFTLMFIRDNRNQYESPYGSDSYNMHDIFVPYVPRREHGRTSLLMLMDELSVESFIKMMGYDHTVNGAAHQTQRTQTDDNDDFAEIPAVWGVMEHHDDMAYITAYQQAKRYIDDIRTHPFVMNNDSSALRFPPLDMDCLQMLSSVDTGKLPMIIRDYHGMLFSDGRRLYHTFIDDYHWMLHVDYTIPARASDMARVMYGELPIEEDWASHYCDASDHVLFNKAYLSMMMSRDDGLMRAMSAWYDIGLSLMEECQHHGGMDVYLKRSEYDTVIDMIMQGMPMEFLTQYILLNDHHVGKVIMNASHLGGCVFNVIEEG